MLITTKKILTSVSIMAATVMMPFAANAQQPVPQQSAPAVDVSDEQLQDFAEATVEMQGIQQEYQEEMAESITEEGLTTMEFQQMAQAKQMGKESEASEDKQAAFEKALAAVMAIQQEMTEKQREVIADFDMSEQEYAQITQAVQQDPDMAKKLRAMMADES